MIAGSFIALEGCEGCGKSTVARLLAGDLDAVLTREPGGTAIGHLIRGVVLDPQHRELVPRAEALLMAADRAQHLAELVEPALTAGRHVVTDRSAFSSLAYQGYGRGLAVEEIRSISNWAMGGRWPDLAIFLDVSWAVAQARIGARQLDRIEQEDHGFHDRVASAFATLAAADPGRWVVVDGDGSPSDVALAVSVAVRERLKL